MQIPLALVTGAGHRVGRILALTLARRGYAVAIVYRSSAPDAQATAKEVEALGVRAYPLQVDLREAEQIRSLFSTLDGIDQTLSVVVNSAAEWSWDRLAQVSVEDWDSLMYTNLRAPFLIAQGAAERMEAGGLIVNISDIAARKTWTRFPAYSVSKAGVEALTRQLARALAPAIRVNALALGFVLKPPRMPDDQWTRLVERVPLQRAASAEDVARALELLLDNGYITGQTLTVDGGYSLL